MTNDEGILEHHTDAAEELETARSYLNSFYDGLEIALGEKSLYDEARKAETEFEKSLFYTLSAPEIDESEINSRVEEMRNESGTPEEVIIDLKELDQFYREYSLEMLEQADRNFNLLFRNLRELDDGFKTQLLKEAEENYQEVLNQAWDEIQDSPDIETQVSEKIEAL